MPKYIPEYDTRIIDADGWINECDNRLYEDPDSGDRLFWVDVDDEFSISGAVIAVPTKDDFRWFARNIKRKGLTPYLKIRTYNLKENLVTGVCRISIYSPKYITGYNENLILTKDVIDILMGELKSEFEDPFTDKVMTKWDRAIDCINSDYGNKKCKYMVPTGLHIPDYYKLLEKC